MNPRDEFTKERGSVSRITNHESRITNHVEHVGQRSVSSTK